MQFLVYLLFVGAAVFIIFAIWMLTSGRGADPTEKAQKRYRNLANPDDYDYGEGLSTKEDREKEVGRQRSIVKKEALSNIPVINKKLQEANWAQKLNDNLRQAKIPLDVGTFLMVCLGCGLIGSGFVYLLQGKVNPVFCTIALVIFAYIPIMYVKIVVAQREKKFTAQLPDALDLLASSVRAGLAFNAAIQNVADEMPDPMCDEFRAFAEELAFNVPMPIALEHFRARVPTVDVKFFCTAIMIQRETGGNLAEILDGLQKTVRERFRIIGQIKTLTAQGRMSGWVLGIMPIALGAIIYAMNPSYMGVLFEERLGHILLMVAGTMQFTGFMLIRKIVDIKV